jgi:hypothetical protein
MKKLMTLMAFAVPVALPAAAHHSGAAFDRELPVQISGAVTEVVWQSPHARLHVAAKDDSGASVSWDFELPSPVTLMRRGWTRNSLRAGDVVTVTGIRARDFPHIAIATGVTDAAGKRLFSGTATSTD